MKNGRRILAWIGILLLVGMYAAALIASFQKSEYAQVIFRGALGCTIIVPVFLYLVLMVAKTVRPSKSAVADGFVFDIGKVLLDYPWETWPDKLELEPDVRRVILEKINSHPLWREFDYDLRPYDDIVEDFTKLAPEYADEIRRYVRNIEDCITPFWYTDGLLHSLKRKGFRLYFLSNWTKESYEKLKAKGIMDFLKYMDGGVWSFETHLAKPDPDIYRTLIDKYELPPKRYVFVDDTQENVEAAQEAGLGGIVFTGYNDFVEKLETIGVRL